MSRIAVVVPALQVLPVLDGLLTLYEVRTDCVAGRVRDCMANKVPAPLLQRERAPLAAIEDTIDQLGWTRVPRDEPATLTAEREIVATAVHAALLSSAEQIVRRCHEHHLPDGELSPSPTRSRRPSRRTTCSTASATLPPSTPRTLPRGNPMAIPNQGCLGRSSLPTAP